MTWRKLGHVFQPDDQYPWMKSHAANPTAEHLAGTRYRIYFATRNENNVSSIGSVDIDITNPTQVLAVSSSPVLSPGEAGLFDDSGTSMGWLLHHQGKRYLYYVGWNLGVTVPWRNSIGLAISDGPDQPFIKVSKAPVMDRNAQDPYSLSYPCVLYNPEKRCFQMWYGSNTKWGSTTADMEHVIKYAESKNGIHWERTGHVAVGLQPGEQAVSRPAVLKEPNGTYRMWFSVKRTTYCIGYAESTDGLNWQRQDGYAGLNPTLQGHEWDSEMVCYPYVFRPHNQQNPLYLLYNGNSYAKTGFGIAVERHESCEDSQP